MTKRLTFVLLALVMSCTLAVLEPKSAYADDGFLGGLQDFVGARELDELTGYENQYTRNYQPVLRSGDGEESEDVEELGTNAAIQTVINQTNTVTWGSNTQGISLLRSIRLFLGESSFFRDKLVLAAAGLVFAWWGVRKSIRILFASFRKGSASI